MEQETVVPQPTQPISIPQPELVAPTPKKFPLLTWLMLILLSVSATISVYLFLQVRSMTLEKSAPSPSPTPIASIDPTSDWETYTNNEYGFTIKYPIEAKIRTEQPPSNDRMFIFAIDSPNAVFDRMFKSGDYSFGISIQTQKNFPELSDYLNFQKEHNTYKNLTPTTVNNVNGFKFQTDGYASTNFIYQGFVTKNDDLYITINYFTDQDLKMFDQILSTFKFTGNNSSDQSDLIKIVQNKIFDYGKSHGLTSLNQIIIKVTKLDGNYAMGTSTFTSDVEGSGSGWFAAKVNGTWIIVEETQEPPSCALMEQYKFPKSFYVECANK